MESHLIVEKTERRLVIMCPGLAGDNEKLANFRSHLAAHFRFFVPTYPDWDEIIRGQASLTLFVDRVVSDVAAQLDRRPLALLGYSFGGLLSHEVAWKLLELGHPVRVVGILDTDITFGPTSPAERNLVRRSLTAKLRNDISIYGFRKAVGMKLAYHLASRVFRSPSIRRVFAHLWRQIFMPQEIAEPFDRLMRVWTYEAVARAWPPRIHHASTVVFRSRRQTVATIPLDLGWSRYASILKVEEVGGTHHSMIAGPHGMRLAHLIKREFDALLGD